MNYKNRKTDISKKEVINEFYNKEIEADLKEKILNTSNSNMRVMENSIYYDNKFWITINQFKKISGMKIDPGHHINNIDLENKIKVDDPLVASTHGRNSYIWFLTREACLYILNKVRNDNLQCDKSIARKNINSFFDTEEASLKTPYRALIDISFGIDGNNQLSCYSDCSDMMLALKNIYESEKIRDNLAGEENIVIKISIDKTMAQRQKI